MSEEDAEWVVVNMNGGIPNGMQHTISVCIADEKGKGKGCGKGDGKSIDLQVAEIEASDNLFVKGLPHEITEAQLVEIFNRYGTVTSVKVLPGAQHPDKPMAKSSALIRMSSVLEAKHMIENWNGRTLHGLRHPVMIKYAGDGVPLVHKIQKMLEGGDKLYYGHIKTFNAEKRYGYIACEEVFKTLNQDVYTHQSVMERGGVGPGDHVIFFMHWKNANGQQQNRPSAAAPMMRIAAEKGFAMKGWYKGIADPEKGFGFIECAELKLIFGRDVYVTKSSPSRASLAGAVSTANSCRTKRTARRSSSPWPPASRPARRSGSPARATFRPRARMRTRCKILGSA
jgi:cold shock CspA family protein